MATIQSKISRGKKYWYIVESRRVNGKPRPIVLAYLGKPEDLLHRLAAAKNFRVKSYSHGLVWALLSKLQALDIVTIINKYIKSPRVYFTQQPVRNGLTGGATLALAAIGRVCLPTSKDAWSNWANETSLEYLLGKNLSALDSQHFWDHMDCIDQESIEKIELEILQSIQKLYGIETDTLFFDATNFFTYINSDNVRCKIAKRGKNKQKRADLRQVGLAVVTSRKDHIPLFHVTYEGNKPDCILFQEVLSTIKKRLIDLGLDFDKHTLVFDKGNNSKKNFKLIDTLNVHYVSSLINSHHKTLQAEFFEKSEEITLHSKLMNVYRCKRTIHGKKRTVVVYISEALKKGQVKGLLDTITKRMADLQKLKLKMKKLDYNREEKEKAIAKIIGKETIVDWNLKPDESGKLSFTYSINENKLKEKLNTSKKKNIIESVNKKIKNLDKLKKKIESSKQEESIKKIIKKLPIDWSVQNDKQGNATLDFSINEGKLLELQNNCGFRILVSDQDNWNTAEIIHAYHGQAIIENEFKNLKNPMHLSCRPQFHWTDQKIRVHFFICIIGHMLSTLLYKEAKEKLGYSECLRSFLDNMNSIRLCSILKAEDPFGTNDKKTLKIEYVLEELTEKQQNLVDVFNITSKSTCEMGLLHVGVYKKNTKKRFLECV